MGSRWSGDLRRRPGAMARGSSAAAVVGLFVAVLVAGCGSPVATATPSASGSAASPAATTGSDAPPSSGTAASPSAASSPSAAPEPGEAAAFYLRGDPPTLDEPVTIRLMNAFIEPSASVTIQAGGAIELAGHMGAGTYTVEARDMRCDGEVVLADGVETDAVVRLDIRDRPTCVVETMGTHAPGEGHLFIPS